MSRLLMRPMIRVARPEDDAVIGEILVNAYVSQYARKLPHIVVDEARKADLRNVAERIAREDWQCEWAGLHVRRGVEGIARMYQRRGYQRDVTGDIDRLPVIFLEVYLKTLS